MRLGRLLADTPIAMAMKHCIYRYIAPFRSRLQKRLRNDRIGVDRDVFATSIEGSGDQVRIAHALWDELRNCAFVADFRPLADDNLDRVFGMGPEEISDELIEPIIAKLGLTGAQTALAGVDFRDVVTPRGVQDLLVRIAQSR